MKQLLIRISLLFVTFNASAQNWSRTPGPVEDNVFDLCIDSNCILYAVTPLGVNRSTDGGDHWTRPFLFTQATTSASAIIALNGNIIIGTSSGIFLSSDSGTTFTRSHSFAPVAQFARSGTGRIFVTGLEWPLYSDDNGESWSEIPVSGSFLYDQPPLAVAAFHNAVIMHGELQTYSSVNNGATWKELPPVEGIVYKLLILPNGTWVSIDNSAGLQQSIPTRRVWETFGGNTKSEYAYNADCLLNGEMFVAGSNGIYHVAGSTWTNITKGLSIAIYKPYYSIPRFVEDPRTGDYYIATSTAGVWKRAALLQKRSTEAEPLPLRVTPNPVTDRAIIEFTEDHPLSVEIELRNIPGAVVWKRQREYSSAGLNEIPLEVHGIPAGNYLLVLRTNERSQSQWVTIVK